MTDVKSAWTHALEAFTPCAYQRVAMRWEPPKVLA